jgi:GAF domain-containing protein
VPLTVKDQIIGLLCLDHTQPGHFSKDRIEDVATLSYQAAVAISNAQMHEKAQQAAALVERARLLVNSEFFSHRGPYAWYARDVTSPPWPVQFVWKNLPRSESIRS